MGRTSESSFSLRRRIGWPVAVAALLGLVPLGPLGPLAAPAQAEDRSTGGGEFCAPLRMVNIAVSRWKIKKKVTVAYDLNEMADTIGVSTSRTRDKLHKRAWGSYWVATLWTNDGLSKAQDVKIGTAKLKRRAEANMVVILDEWHRVAEGQSPGGFDFAESSTRTTMVLFKGSRTADVYGRFDIKVLKPGKTVNYGGGSYRLAKPIKLTRGHKYRATNEPDFAFTSFPPLPPDPAPNSEYGDEYIRSDCRQAHRIYYNNGMYATNVTITGPTTHRSVAVYVKNQAQSLNSKLDAKNKIYKAARKLVGKPSVSCDDTVRQALVGSKVNRGSSVADSLNLPLAAGRTGDAVPEPGHISIFTGPGAMAIHGDVFSHTTFRQNSPLRHTYYVNRPYSNLFRYR